MELELVYRVSSIVAIIAALVTAISGGVQWWSGNVLSQAQGVKVATMEKDVRIKRPAIFSQEAISQNVPENGLFVHVYLISINSPIQHVPLYTYIQYDLRNGDINRVGNMRLNDVGSGVRQVEDQNVSYIDTEYTVKTDRMLLPGEAIDFSFDQRRDVINGS